MRRSPSLCVLLSTVALATCLVADSSGQVISRPAARGFLENRGQFATDARFVYRTPGADVGIHDDGRLSVWLTGSLADGTLARRLVSFRILGFRSPSGRDPSPGLHHFLTSDSEHRWIRDVRAHPTVFLTADGSDHLLTIRAEPHRLTLRLPGVGAETEDHLEVLIEAGDAAVGVREDGALELASEVGTLRLVAGRGAEITPGVATASAQGRAVRVAGTVSAVATDPIELGIEWVTTLPASDFEGLTGAVGHPSGDTILIGRTESDDFPTTPGVLFPVASGNSHSFVSRLDGVTGGLVYSTYLTGPTITTAYCVALDANGGAIIGGNAAAGLPVTPDAYDADVDLADAFILQLTPDAKDVVYCSYFGLDASGSEIIEALWLEESGALTIAGRGGSGPGSIPITPGAFDPIFEGSSEGFVARFAPDRSLDWATYLGGPGSEVVEDMIVHSSGDVVVVGRTSAGFPVTPGAFRTTASQGEGFVSRISSDGSRLVFSTFIGGTKDDEAIHVAESPSGDLVIAGITRSDDFPITPDAYDSQINLFSDCCIDGFVSQLSADGSRMLYSTYLGGNASEDRNMDMVVQSSGAVTVAMETTSTLFPTTPGAFSDRNIFGSEVLVARLVPDGSALSYATFVGSVTTERGAVLAEHADGSVTVATTTKAAEFTGKATPTATLPDRDVAVVKLTMLPVGMARYGDGTPTCGVEPATGALAQPAVGAHDFAMTCWGVPPGASGFLALAASPLATPIHLAGARVWVDPASVLQVRRVTADGFGYVEVHLPIPDSPSLVGQEVFAQFLWADPCVPGDLAASTGLRVRIQP